VRSGLSSPLREVVVELEAIADQIAQRDQRGRS
jgi:hypothetical protein